MSVRTQITRLEISTALFQPADRRLVTPAAARRLDAVSKRERTNMGNIHTGKEADVVPPVADAEVKISMRHR
jgi:hypothetical protein